VGNTPSGEQLFCQVLVVGSSRFILGQLECLQLAAGADGGHNFSNS
jgi:hypothetical protein